MLNILFQAIRDGVIEASIDHEQGFMRSKVRVHTVSLSSANRCTE